MTPIFLPHTALDAMGEVGAALLPEAAQQGRMNLRALRDRALAKGAQVLLLVWPTLEWVLLAVEPPADVVIEDAAQLIPNLMANPDALAQMQQNARQGQHLTWLQLLRPASAAH
ncbi:hypothetical protein D3C78_408850 [compost metagenome]